MLAERLLRPGYRVMVFGMKKFEPGKVIEGFRRRGAHVKEIRKEFGPELEVDSFLSTTYGKYVYVLHFADVTYLARSMERIIEESWGSPGSYLVRNESGLRRFLLRELSLKSKLLLDVPSVIIWMAISLGIINRIEKNPIGSFLLVFLGIFFSDAAKFLEYLLLGYCRA